MRGRWRYPHRFGGTNAVVVVGQLVRASAHAVLRSDAHAPRRDRVAVVQRQLLTTAAIPCVSKCGELQLASIAELDQHLAHIHAFASVFQACDRNVPGIKPVHVRMLNQIQLQPLLLPGMSAQLPAAKECALAL